ncbi:hypothetical protein [Lyngbya confervoides]|uniref:EcsC family protein n=1 Tax=Lyngbya confervoides BDU141951 TaxID=1574623 RepID=A0ABD4T1D6_9CYAN|nr:hypothetical protein [Lyngbya confervoides]MCM1982339.1 hypothetical protein [Lyngbya confervoides BDU141951]
MANSSWPNLDALTSTWIQTCNALQSAAQSSSEALQQQIEPWAETLGQVLVPIADFPILKPLSKTPGLGWIAAALGQVNLAAIAQDIDSLRQQAPLAPPETMAQQMIQETAFQAAGIGLATNFLPPLAITLFAVDMAAIATLQAELIYRIAAIYDYDIQDKTRRGEILALYAGSAGGSTLLKSGLSFPEVIPVLGAVLGASSDAAIVWSIGQAANQYYRAKRHRDNRPEMPSDRKP